MTADPLKDALSEMATSLLKEAMTSSGSDEVPLTERVAVFRACTAYYAMINKLDPPDDDSKKGAYGGYRDKIESADGKRKTGRGANGAVSR